MPRPGCAPMRRAGTAWPAGARARRRPTAGPMGRRARSCSYVAVRDVRPEAQEGDGDVAPAGVHDAALGLSRAVADGGDRLGTRRFAAGPLREAIAGAGCRSPLLLEARKRGLGICAAK